MLSGPLSSMWAHYQIMWAERGLYYQLMGSLVLSGENIFNQNNKLDVSPDPENDRKSAETLWFFPEYLTLVKIIS